jgi:hypothetical protein
MWSDEDIANGCVAFGPGGPSDVREHVRSVMTFAVELAAARGGTMTAEDIAECRRLFGLPPAAKGWGDETVRDLLNHIAAQGTRVAVLEAERNTWRKAAEEGGRDREAVMRTQAERIAALDQHVSDLEKSLENARTERDEMRALLGPSGQVAEDVAALEAVFWDDSENQPWMPAFRRLAAGAQRADRLARVVAYIQECDGGPHLLTEANALASDRVDDVRAERDEATSPLDAIRKRSLEAANLERLISEHGLSAAMRWVVDGSTAPPRHPCSETCTHDDAATPGHPERVKERSEAFIRSVGTYHPAGPSAYEQGAEAMRAACWEMVLGVLGRHGLGASGLSSDIKAAIEGATP